MRFQPLAIIAAAYEDVYENWRGLLRVGALWLLATQGFRLLMGWNGTDPMTGGLIEVVVSIIEFVAWAAIAVTWHRHIILKEPLRGPIAPLNGTVFRYLVAEIVAYLIIGAATLAVALPFAFAAANAAPLAFLFAGAIVLGSLALFARLAVWFPAIAVGDRSIGWGRSIELTQGHTFSIAIGFVLATLPITLVCLPVFYLLTNVDGIAAPFLMFVFSIGATLVSIAVTVAFLSLTYLALARPPEDGASSEG